MSSSEIVAVRARNTHTDRSIGAVIWVGDTQLSQAIRDAVATIRDRVDKSTLADGALVGWLSIDREAATVVDWRLNRAEIPNDEGETVVKTVPQPIVAPDESMIVDARSGKELIARIQQGRTTGQRYHRPDIEHFRQTGEPQTTCASVRKRTDVEWTFGVREHIDSHYDACELERCFGEKSYTKNSERTDLAKQLADPDVTSVADLQEGSP